MLLERQLFFLRFFFGIINIYRPKLVRLSQIFLILEAKIGPQTVYTLGAAPARAVTFKNRAGADVRAGALQNRQSALARMTALARVDLARPLFVFRNRFRFSKNRFRFSKSFFKLFYVVSSPKEFLPPPYTKCLLSHCAVLRPKVRN